MSEVGLEQAIQAAGRVEALARCSDISPLPASSFQRIPTKSASAESTNAHAHETRGLATKRMSEGSASPATEVDDIDLLRAQEYDLLAVLLGRAPTREVLERLRELKGDPSPLGLAHLALAEAAATTDPDALQQEFFDLFVGIGRGELLPYGSYYLTGFLHERPLASVRESLGALGIERAEDVFEPEDHIAILCEVMAGLTAGRFETEAGADRRFFERHLQPWAPRFFADLETAKHAHFYRTVGRVGGLFMDIEAEAFAMDA
jgi:TorA maturation chaperone TorD